MAPVTHIVGAGLAGLSAARPPRERGRGVAVYEAAGQAGGGRPLLFDSGFGAVIDNGNRLSVVGSTRPCATSRSLAARTSSKARSGPSLPSPIWKPESIGSSSIGEGRWPSWMFDAGRRVPGTKPADYFPRCR